MSALGPCGTAPLQSGMAQRVPRRFRAGFRKVPGDRWRIHLEIHPRGLRLQRAGQHADHVSHRVGAAPRSLAMRSAPACRTSTGCPRIVVFSHVAARFFTPQVSGIGATPGGATVFRIDHDENFNQTTHLQYQPWKKGPWLSFNWRYDSGLVAGRGALRRRQLQQRAQRDGYHRGRVRPHAGSAVRGRTVLRQRACDAHHSDQPDRPVPRVAVRFDAGQDSGAPAPKTTTTTRRASRRAACSTSPSATTISSTATSTSGAPA